MILKKTGWDSKFKKGSTHSTRMVGKIYICRNCGKRIAFLAKYHSYCNDSCKSEFNRKQQAMFRAKRKNMLSVPGNVNKPHEHGI